MLDADFFDRLRQADLAFTRFNAARSLQDADSALTVTAIGRAHVLTDPARPEPYYNRVIGLSEADAPSLGAIIDAAAPGPCTVTLAPDQATPLLLTALGARSFRLIRTEVVCAIRADRISMSADPMPIRRAGRDDLDRIIDLWAPDTPPAIRARRREQQLHPDFWLYLARLDGQEVAMASTFFAHGIAWLGNAGTAPGFRRRGCQGALLRRRLWDARQAGCQWAITDTDFGTTSHRNAARVGMSRSFSLLTLARPTG